MKKTIYIMMVAVVATLAMTSCTHKKGDIGPWFGTWHVEKYEIDGKEIGETSSVHIGANFFQFQSSLVQLRYSGVNHDEQVSTGTWQNNGNEIVIKFPDAQLIWAIIVGFDMTPGAENHLKVEKQDGSNAVLSLTSTDGHTYRYTLKKWG